MAAGVVHAAEVEAEVKAEVGAEVDQGQNQDHCLAAEVEVEVVVAVEVAGAEAEVRVEAGVEAGVSLGQGHAAEVAAGADQQVGQGQGHEVPAEVEVLVKQRVAVKQKTEERKMKRRFLVLTQIVTESFKWVGNWVLDYCEGDSLVNQVDLWLHCTGTSVCVMLMSTFDHTQC